MANNIFKQQTLSEFNLLLENNPSLNLAYTQLGNNSDFQQRFKDYMCGTKTLPLTYDPFFKKIFDVHEHPERLSNLISSMIGKKVKVKEVLNSEHRIFKDSPLLVMDILVELEDGSYSNVEIQKIGYYFSGQRISCYISDLVQRQYALVKDKQKNHFSYRNLKPVYIIVLIEKTTKEYHLPELNNAYIHHGNIIFDTHLKIDMLENVHIAALDIFAETAYHKIIEDIPKNKKTHLDHSTLFNDLNMWLSLLCTETIENAEKPIQIFPTLKEVFMDMQEYTTKPSEAINMFSEALKILDINTVNYMVDDMKAEIEAQKTELSIKNNIINELKNKTDKQDTIIDNQNHTINSLKSTINDINTTLENLKQELFQLKNKENEHKT